MKKNFVTVKKMCFFSFTGNSSMCHVLPLNYSVWIQIRIFLIFGFGSGKKFRILSDSDPQHWLTNSDMGHQFIRYRYLPKIYDLPVHVLGILHNISLPVPTLDLCFTGTGTCFRNLAQYFPTGTYSRFMLYRYRNMF
jgi:hypothetical protein